MKNQSLITLILFAQLATFLFGCQSRVEYIGNEWRVKKLDQVSFDNLVPDEKIIKAIIREYNDNPWERSRHKLDFSRAYFNKNDTNLYYIFYSVTTDIEFIFVISKDGRPIDNFIVSTF